MIAVAVAGLVSLLSSILGGRALLALLARNEVGDGKEAPAAQSANAMFDGAPPFGGAVIVGSAVLGYAVAHLTGQRVAVSSLLLMGLFLALGILGLAEDLEQYRKHRLPRRRRPGRRVTLIVICLVFAFLSLQFPDSRGLTPASTFVSFLRDINGLQLPMIIALLWLVAIITVGTSGMRLVNSQDGLGVGVASMIFVGYGLINIWQQNQSCERTPGPACYEVRDPLDLAVVSAAIAVACSGLIWWNCKPARLGLGRAGALALGGAMAGLAIMTRTELLFLLLGGLVVLDVFSLGLQAAWFRISGRRLFPMAPMHHTFEVIGWPEETVTVRLWLLQGMLVAGGLALFYAEWVTWL